MMHMWTCFAAVLVLAQLSPTTSYGARISPNRITSISKHNHRRFMQYTEHETSQPTRTPLAEGWDPMGFSAKTQHAEPTLLLAMLPVLALVMGLTSISSEAVWAAADASSNSMSSLSTQSIFDPSQFTPVCPASDGVYNILKITANTVVGADNVQEYGPLIASILLRIRLELCVLESFLYEAVVPFVQKKGLSWVLPLHETTETFLAGTIFAIGSNFILLGSTKILSILFIYADVITGMPTRFIGGQLKKSKEGAAANVGAVFKAYGDVLGTLRTLLETGDTFVGRYLVIFTTVYVTFKLAHYKLFNDIIPF